MATTKTLAARLRSIPAAVKSWFGSEGSWRGPFFGQGELGGWYQLDPLGTGWQRNLDIDRADVDRFGPVYACVAVISQEMSRIHVKHMRTLEDGSTEEVKNKALYRVMRKPNRYQTRSDFMLYMMRSLLLDGNAYAIATRNERFEVDALYPLNPRQTRPYVASSGEVFYQHSDTVMQELANLDEGTWYPQRDVLHIRLFCPRHLLIGESPITAALLPAAAGLEINRHTAQFFHNMSRPSGVLRHPGEISEEAMVRAKKRFMEVTQQNHTGEPLVLPEGMSWAPLSLSAVDSELIRSYELTERQTAQIFRVPSFLLNDLEKTSFNNTEALSRFFINSTLGFHVEHFENALRDFFALPSDEEVHFDVEAALLRGEMKERAEAYARMAQNGVMSSNEMRRREGLPPVENGDEPRVQQQLVPLSYGAGMQPPGSAPIEEAPPAEEEDEPTEEQELAAAIVARRAIEKAMS